MGPDTIASDLPRVIPQSFVARDLDLPSNRLQRCLEPLLCLKVIGIAARRVQLIHKVIGAIRAHNNFVAMQAKGVRAVFEDTSRGKKDEGENDRDHHVVMQSAARMCPQNVALDGLAEFQKTVLDFESRLRTY